MIKAKFEIWFRNKETLGVIAKCPRLAFRLNKQYKRYDKPKFIKGEEALFWVPLASKDTLKGLLRLRGPLNLEMAK